MLKKILLGLAGVIVVFVIVVATRPTDFRVVRSATIPAAPGAVFPYVNDLKKWQEWSPWAKLDPNAKNTFEGPTAGAGAKFSWAGNNDVGVGSMTITESKSPELVRIKLSFLKPMEGDSDVVFTLKPEAGGTLVTWAMDGKNGFVGKAVSLFMDCEKMCGDQFEQGFKNLKAVIAAPPAPAKVTQAKP
ncbi:MAG: SRPBCC family protein [Limisphaerales bacterium]